MIINHNTSIQTEIIIKNAQERVLNNTAFLQKIFYYISNQNDWKSCYLTSKQWKEINEELLPLTKFVNAIINKDGKIIKEILNKNNYNYLHLKIRDSRYCPNVQQTPLLCAREYDLPKDLLSILEGKDGGFTDKFLNWKLHSLRHDINPKVKIKECLFSGEGLDHFSHHNYLLPNLIDSLKRFFNQGEGSVYWNHGNTERLLRALEIQP
jgi:hypothetical protein